MRIQKGRVRRQSSVQLFLNMSSQVLGLCDGMAVVVSPMYFFILTEAVAMKHLLD
jgi:hypothetical protein